VGGYIRVPKAKWNRFGAILGELYGMVHSLNDYLGNDQLDIAKKEAGEIEKEVVKVLDRYNKVEQGSD